MQRLYLAITFLFAAVMILCLSCCSGKQDNGDSKDKTKRVGKYVYIDQSNCLHTDKRCRKIRFSRDEDGNYSNYQVNFVRTSSLEGNEYTGYCGICVTDEMYEDIIRVVSKSDDFEDEFQEADTVAAEIDSSKDVYICTGEKAKAYHLNVACPGLNKCDEALSVITEQEAKAMRRTPCRICYKETD